MGMYVPVATTWRPRSASTSRRPGRIKPTLETTRTVIALVFVVGKVRDDDDFPPRLLERLHLFAHPRQLRDMFLMELSHRPTHHVVKATYTTLQEYLGTYVLKRGFNVPAHIKA